MITMQWRALIGGFLVADLTFSNNFKTIFIAFLGCFTMAF